MLDVKRFNGVMDKDSSLFDIQQNCHIAAKNVRFVLGNNGATAYNIKGNYVIPNGTLPPGNNEAIGSFFDQVNQRIIWFNWNQYGVNGIFQYSIQTGLVTPIFRVLVNSSTDILGFNPSYPIASCNIVYRTPADGDLLYWTDGLNRPMYLNLSTVSTMSPFTSDMINAAKNAPGTPITAVYQNDAATNSNSLKKKLFRFCYRWWYKNLEKSTFSPISEVALPISEDNPFIANDPTKNNNIRLTIYTGGSDFQAVELAVQESDGETWSDFKSAEIFDKDDYNLTPSSSFTFDFYNNGGYNPITTEETDLYFDWLPNKANTLELLNGNVVIYGGVTDGTSGLSRENVNVQITSTTTTNPLSGGNYGFEYKWSGWYRFGLQYYDDRNKPIGGVVSFVSDPVDTNDFAVSTPDYSLTAGFVNQFPLINASINHTPPVGATKYQWVRTENQVTKKFLYYCTNDYQNDSSYLYFCLQNLIEQKTLNTGSVLSYEFTPGDRIKIIGYFTPSGSFRVFNTQLDFEVLGTVERIMTNPASNGTFIKVLRPTTFPSSPYVSTMLYEIYTPSVNTDETQLAFYEFGEKYDIYESGGSRYHRGGVQNQTGVQAATFQWTDGDVYFRSRNFGRVPTISVDLFTFIMDANYSDFFSSAVNSNGRVWLIDENIKEEYNGVLVRWGGKYQSGTNINALNRFRPNDFDEADRSRGDIRKFKARDRILRVAQDRGIGQYGIYARFIQNNEGQPELVTTNEIITSNNIKYYQGTFGVCGYATNFVSTPTTDYFTDVVTGRGMRLSGDGITDLGVLYKGQFYFPDWVFPYAKDITRSNGYSAKVMGYFDDFDNEYHTILQAGTLGGVSYSNRHFSFNEPRNGYCCDEYDFNPEWAISVNGITYTWVNGYLWKHDVNGSNYCNFYGTQYDATLTIVFNKDTTQKKSWNSIAETASDIWDCPEIESSTVVHGATKQQTNLVSAEFQVLEGQPSTSIKRAANSRNGKVNGDFIKGQYLKVKLRKQNANSLISLSEIYCRYTDSPLTPVN